jgi:hypothetical protein
MPNDWSVFDEIIDRWKPCGERILTGGSRLVCPMPQVGPEAWLHEVFAPLSAENIEVLEREVGRKIPEGLRAFYRHANGAILFANALAIYGLRRNYERVGDQAFQPYALELHNRKSERPPGLPETFLIVGRWHDIERYLICMDGGQSDHVFEFAASGLVSTKRWASLREYLDHRLETIARFFDRSGHRIRSGECA